MCDTNNNTSKGKYGKDGPPEVLPGWLKCPPVIRERNYPVPDGVDITPISQGGRNGPSKKKQFKCGQCGQDARPKPDAKPNAPADCPMMKARGCSGSGIQEKNEGKGGSILDRMKNFFGIGKGEDYRLVEACKRLNIPDEQIRHQRDVFNIPLLCGKDGYFSPLVTRVDCAGLPEGPCTCGSNQMNDEEEELEYEDDEDECEEYEDEEEYCEDEEEEVCEDEDFEEQVEDDPNCNCGCKPEKEDTDAKVEEKEEEECVEDGEGECILEESAECMDPDCKLFLEPPPQNTGKGGDIKKENCCKVEKSQEEQKRQECLAMNNFIIRVQSPFSESNTNETCEQIIERLTSKMPTYPEPKPRQETGKGKTTDRDNGPAANGIVLVVKQISVEEPTCECPPKPIKCKNVEPVQVDDCALPPPSPPVKEYKPLPKQAPIDDCAPPPPLANDCPPPPQQPPPTNDCEPPPPVTSCESPPGAKCECVCTELPVEKEENASTISRPPPKKIENHCLTLTEEELLRKPIKDIKCGCPIPNDKEGPCERPFINVWTPPPPPPCSRCGVPERGSTEDCYLCHLTRQMRSGCPAEREGVPCFSEDPQVCPKEEPTDFCTPEYLEDGSIKYKGGMCMSLANQFLWHVFKRTPPGGFFDQYTGECGVDVRQQAVGANPYGDDDKKELLKPEGGITMDKCRQLLWGIKPTNEEQQEIRKCKTPEQKKSDQCARTD